MTKDAFAPGTLIGGRYVIEHVLGKGGMGTVFRAHHATLQTPLAIKILHAQYSSSAEYRTRFVREARVNSTLKHPNAVHIIDFGEHEGVLYIAMELLQGPSLREALDRYGDELEFERIHRYATTLADVIREAHHIGLVHRDLKPENVMVENPYTERERLVVVDFGLAFIEDDPEGLGRMTETGVIVGTPLYVAPEQAQGDAVDGSVDVYSLGCMLYEMASGQPPFEGRTTLQILNKHIFNPPTPLVSRIQTRSIPSSFSQLVMKMLEKDPRKRISIWDVCDELTHSAQNSTTRPRGRGQSALQDRAERAVTINDRGDQLTQPIDAPPLLTRTDPAMPPSTVNPLGPTAPAPAVLPAAQLIVGLYGLPLDDDLRQQFAANQVIPIVHERAEPGPKDRVFIAPGLDPDQVAAIFKAGVAVITTTAPGDMERISQLVRAGAAEVLVLPLDYADLLRKTLRAARKAQRRSPGKST